MQISGCKRSDYRMVEGCWYDLEEEKLMQEMDAPQQQIREAESFKQMDSDEGGLVIPRVLKTLLTGKTGSVWFSVCAFSFALCTLPRYDSSSGKSGFDIRWEANNIKTQHWPAQACMI